MRTSRRVWPSAAISLLVVASACSVSGSPSIAPASGATGAAGAAASVGSVGSALPSTYSGTPEAPTPALQVKGKSELNAAVVTIAPTQVLGIAADGVRFTMAASAASSLKAGSVFLVPDIAARKVTAVRVQGDVALVDTEPAATDELFSDLDVAFDQVPDDAGAIVGGDPVIAAGDATLGSSDNGTDAADPSASSGAATVTTASSGLRRAARDQNCRNSDASLALTIDNITVTPSFGFTPDCRGVTFGAEVTATSGIISAGLSFRATVAVSRITGHLTGGASGDATSASIAVKAAGTAGGSAKANEPGGAEKRYKVSWDLLKEDFPFNVDGVPFLLRVGVPFIVEPRFSGGGDSVSGKLADFTCDGVLSVAGAADEKDICHAAAVGVDSFTSIAPSAIVVAMGLKLGIGPGIAVKKKAQIFGGIVGTAAYSVGVSTTGATSGGLLDCVRVDRSLAFYAGLEATVLNGKYTVTTNKEVWSKSATNSYGSRCPKN